MALIPLVWISYVAQDYDSYELISMYILALVTLILVLAILVLFRLDHNRGFFLNYVTYKVDTEALPKFSDRMEREGRVVTHIQYDHDEDTNLVWVLPLEEAL